jgi:hypothetical protein
MRTDRAGEFTRRDLKFNAPETHETVRALAVLRMMP